MFQKIAAVMLLFGLCVASQASVVAGPNVSVTQSDGWQFLAVRVSEQLDFKLKGAWLLPNRGYLSVGRTAAPYVMTSGSEHWLLVPFTEVGSDGREFRSEVADLSGQSYIGIEFLSGRVYPRVVDLTFSGRLKAVPKRVKFSNEVELLNTPSIKAEGFFSEQESQRYFAELASAEAKSKTANRPVVTLIGSKVCKHFGDITYIGHTQQVRARGDEILVHVEEAKKRWRAGFVRPDGFSPSTIWVEADDWVPCQWSD